MQDIRNDYFWWMLSKIFHDSVLAGKYRMLLEYLNSIPFSWTLEMDENRQKDAQDLRYIFGAENGYSESQICQELDIIEPSLLEVIVALINRAEENILYDPDKQYNLNQDIFMDILRSLGIEDCTGILTSEQIKKVNEAIDILYKREYTPYGEGGLFIVDNPKDDMRNTELWFQFMWYLDEKLGGKYL